MTASPQLSATQVGKLLEGVRIPPQPALLQKVMTQVRAGDPDLGAIATAISGDVGISGALIKTVNSPFFGLRARVSSVQHAASLLGLKNVVGIVTGLALRAAMDQKGMRLERFWDSATDTALACAAIARELRVGKPDEAHTLGLFHDCGIPLLMQKFPDYLQVLKRANSASGRSLVEVEEEAIGTNHAVVAYYVAKSWGLPDLIADAILQHHDLLGIDEAAGELASLVAVLCLAEQVAHHHRRANDNFEWERLGPRVLEVLCLDEEEYEELLEDVGEMLSSR